MSDGWRRTADVVPHRDDCPGIGNGCTTDYWSATVGDVVRARDWSIGDVIEGCERDTTRFDVKRLRIQWIGKEVVVFTRVMSDGSNGREEANWTLSCRCWGLVSR